MNIFITRWIRQPTAPRHLAGAFVLGMLATTSALATPSLVIDAESGAILSQEDATQPWYPASLTKLMTVYVALDAVKHGHLTLDAPLMISANATRVPPSRMGFRPGTEVTLDNALKMLMVKSANDIAVVVAEGIAGSVDSFASEMNATAARLGMRDSHFVNPNGLPNPLHVSSARDMAILARALLRDFPDHAQLFDIGALDLDGRIIPTHNGLLGRYPGADGMKTGFTCAAGFNVVASATQNGRKLIAVVLGAPSAKSRTQKAAELFDHGFTSWSGIGAIDGLPAGSGSPPDMRKEACSHRARGSAAWAGEVEDFTAPIVQVQGFFGSATQQSANIAALPRPSFAAVPIFIGRLSSWTGDSLSASNPALKHVPATATAYVPTAKPGALITDQTDDGSPLKPDPAANPMNLAGAAVIKPLAKPAKLEKSASLVSPKGKHKAIKLVKKVPLEKPPLPSEPN